MSLVRELRLIPVVLFATVCLLALKILGFLVDGGVGFEIDAPQVTGYRGANERPATTAAPRGGPSGSWAREMFNFPDVTGSVQSAKPADKPEAKPGPQTPPENPGGTVIVPASNPTMPPGERALLERLQERRQELDARARELEIRENLVRTAEKQLELRMGELKALEESLKSVEQQKDEEESKKFKSLVTMYENMRAKDAAKIFDRLELKVLLDVASQINPRRMSDIMAQMAPEMAEKLTVELASRAKSTFRNPSPDELPKIEGRPKTP